MSSAATSLRVIGKPLIASTIDEQWTAISHTLVEGGLTRVCPHRRGLSAMVDDRFVIIDCALGDPGAWLVVRTPVCARAEMDPELTLERNDTLAFAALLLSRGMYWLRLAVPLDSRELREPVGWVKRAVRAARSLRATSRHHGRRRSQSVFVLRRLTHLA